MMEPRWKRDPYGLVGTLLADRYRLEGLVGIGGMSVVYRARHQVTTADVAVKILKPDLALADPEMVEAFFREAKAIVGLDHPHIIKVTDAALTEDGIPFLVMEWLSGHTLEEEIRRHAPLPPERVALLLDQMGEALAHAHARGIVHRDVKPSNVMIVSDHQGEPRIKILDFGIAKALAATRARVSRAMGTVQYASPEQFRPGAEIDPRADIYSLGVVLYQMLTGRVPFAFDSIEQMIYAHMHEEPPSLRHLRPDLPPAVDEVVARALAKDPEQRYASATDLARAFRHALGLRGGVLRISCRDAVTRAGVAAALIYIDGRFAGQTDAEGMWAAEEVSPRTHLVEVDAADHHLWRETVRIESGQEQTLVALLQPWLWGSVRVECGVAGAEVFVDGARAGVTDERGRCLVHRLAVGRHRITVRHPQYSPARATCDVVHGEIGTLTLVLRPRRWRALWDLWRGETTRITASETLAVTPAPVTASETMADALTQRVRAARATQPFSSSRRYGLWGGALVAGCVMIAVALWIGGERGHRSSSLATHEAPAPLPQPPGEMAPPPPEVAPPSPPFPAPLPKAAKPSPAKKTPTPLVRRPSSVVNPPDEDTTLPTTASREVPSAPPMSEGASPAPANPLEHVRRGTEYFNVHRYEDALAEYRRAQQLDPSSPDIFYLIGLVYERRGDHEAALEAFRRCTSGPYAAIAQNHVKRLEKKMRRKRS